VVSVLADDCSAGGTLVSVVVSELEEIVSDAGVLSAVSLVVDAPKTAPESSPVVAGGGGGMGGGGGGGGSVVTAGVEVSSAAGVADASVASTGVSLGDDDETLSTGGVESTT
jgi:hypothetical protein